MHSVSFRTKVLASYAVIILLLAGGMVFAIRQLAALTTAEVTRLQGKENEITETELLRWSGWRAISSNATAVGRG